MAKRGGDGFQLAGIDSAARDVLGDERQPAGPRQLHRAGRIRRHHRFDTVPDQLWQIVVPGIFIVRNQTSSDGPAIAERHALQCRSEVKPHDRRRIELGHGGEFTERFAGWIIVFTEQLNRPGANVRVVVAEVFQQLGFAQATRDMQRPKSAQTMIGVFIFEEHFFQGAMGAFGQFAFDRPALKNNASAAGVPGAGAGLVLDQFGFIELGHIGVSACPVLGQALFRREAEDAAGVLLQHVLAANVGIVPVEHIHVATRANLHAEANPLCIIGLHEILVVFTNETGAAWHQFICQHSMLMNISHEDFSLILVRKRIR